MREAFENQEKPTKTPILLKPTARLVDTERPNFATVSASITFR